MRNNRGESGLSDCIFSVGNHIDTQELLLICDLLITDYSSCYIDFLHCNKPIIHYLFDGEYYQKNDRGLYYSFKDVAAGPIIYDEAELISNITDCRKIAYNSSGFRTKRESLKVFFVVKIHLILVLKFGKKLQRRIYEKN